MLRNQTWLDQTSTLGYNVAGTWNNLGYKNDPTTTTAAHVGNHRTRVIAGDAQARLFKNKECTYVPIHCTLMCFGNFHSSLLFEVKFSCFCVDFKDFWKI